jgi:hypothetical protein
MLIKDFSLFLESLNYDYTIVKSSWELFSFCIYKLEGKIDTKIVENIFFWNSINTTTKSIYNQKRIESETGTKVPPGIKRVSNHWSWRLNDVTYAPLCGFENREIQNIWIVAEWQEPAIPSGWTKGFIKNIIEDDEKLYGFVKAGEIDAYMGRDIINDNNLNKNDHIFFKFFMGDKGPIVSQVMLANSCYEPLILGEPGDYKEEINKIRKNIRKTGHELIKTAINTGKISNQRIEISYCLEIGTDEKWKEIRDIISTNYIYTLTSRDTKGKLKTIQLDDNKKINFMVNLNDREYIYHNYSINELKAELYRLKRVIIDKNPTFDFK